MRPMHRSIRRVPARVGRGRATRLLAVLGAILVFVATACVAEGAWARATVPDPAVPGPSRSFPMDDVGCATATTCLAVGPNGAAAYDGTWSTILPPPESITGASVGCLPSGTCLVAGTGATSGAGLWSWSGTAWSGNLLAGVLPVVPASISPLACGAIDCALAGAYTPAGVSQAFALRYDGSTFRNLGVPASTDPRAGTAVSCATASVCVVSTRFTNGIAEILRADGTTWSTLTPVRANGHLTEISCPTADACVGITPETYVSRPTTFTIPRFVSWRTGSPWTQITVPSPTSSPFSSPMDIDCAGPDRCIANVNDTSYEGHVAVWDGTTLTLAEPLPVRTKGLDCVADGRCISVADDLMRERNGFTAGTGDDVQQPLFIHRDTTGLRFDRSASGPPGPSNSRFTDVVCLTKTSCIAVGWIGEGDRQRSLVGTFDGSAWKVTPAPTTDDVRLESIACPTADRCVAVGGRYEFQRVKTNVVRTWNGMTWADVPGNFGGPGYYDRGLTEVACSTPTRCVAAGDLVTVQSWDGPWQLVPERHGSYAPYSSACLPNGPCYMVFNESLMAWDGATWQQEALPPIERGNETYNSLVQGVGCATQGPHPRCLVAIGAFGSLNTHLIAEGGPGGWAKTLPTADNAQDTVDELACSTNDQCVVIGGEIIPQDHVRNGGDWIPLPQRTLADVVSLSCVPGRCVHAGSVGDAEDGTNPSPARRPAAEVYDLAAPRR